MDERNRQQMILQMIRKEKIVAIVRGIPSRLILDTGRALADGGICMMEVTFDHSGPEGIRETLHSIALLKEHLSERMHIGQPSSNLAHGVASVLGTVAAASKYHHQPPGMILAQGGKKALHAYRIVGVVHQDRTPG